MKLTILLICLSLAQASESKAGCDGIIIKGVYHDKETLVPEKVTPSFLDVDYKTNDLYFTYSQTNSNYTNLTKINLTTKQLTHIPGIANGNAYAIDHEKKVFYVGRPASIDRYDLNDNTSTNLSTDDKAVVKMYNKNALYFLTGYFNINWYVVTNGTFSLFKDLTDALAQNFIIDDDDTMYFNNDTGLFRQKVGSAALLVEKRASLTAVTSMVFDPKGQLYAVLSKSDNTNENYKEVYLVDKGTLQLDWLFNITNANDVAFDRDGNFIYTEWYGAIHRLLPNNNKKCT